MPISHEIRLAKCEDLLTIKTIEFEANPFPWTEQALRTSLNPPNQCYVLCASNTVEAYLIGFSAAQEASLLHIVVSKPNQGKGLATKLLSFWLDHLRDGQNIDECWLEVRQSNLVAQQMYQNLGFKQVSIRKAYYANSSQSNDNAVKGERPSREDALIYRLILNQE